MFGQTRSVRAETVTRTFRDRVRMFFAFGYLKTICDYTLDPDSEKPALRHRVNLTPDFFRIQE